MARAGRAREPPRAARRRARCRTRRRSRRRVEARGRSARPTTCAASSSRRSRDAIVDAQKGDDLLGAPLATLDDAEVEEVRRAVRAFVQRLRGGERVRRRRARSGRIDAHATLRRAMRTGGVPFMLLRRARRRDKPRLVLLCDVSDSVRNVARFLLELTYASQELFDRTRTFVFVSELGETTRLFAEEPIETALSHAPTAGAVVPVTHNSNYGRVLRAFEERVLRGASIGGPPSSILGDGRTNYQDDAAEVARRRPRPRARGRVAVPGAARGVGNGRQRDAPLRAEVHARPRGAAARATSKTAARLLAHAQRERQSPSVGAPTTSSLPLQALAHPEVVLRVDDHGADAVERLDELEALLRAEDEDGVVDLVGEERGRRPDRDASAGGRRVAGSRIDDVVVALAADDVAALVVARGAEGVIGERELREVLALGAARIADAGLPVAAVGLLAAREEIAARLDEERREPGLLEDRDRAVDGVALGDAAEADLRLRPSRASPSSSRRRRTMFLKPTNGSRALMSLSAGGCGSRSSSNFQRPCSVWKVMSNVPSEISLVWIELLDDREASRRSTLHGGLARGGVDLRDLAVGTPRRHQRLDPADLGDRGVERRRGSASASIDSASCSAANARCVPIAAPSPCTRSVTNARCGGRRGDASGTTSVVVGGPGSSGATGPSAACAGPRRPGRVATCRREQQEPLHRDRARVATRMRDVDSRDAAAAEIAA